MTVNVRPLHDYISVYHDLRVGHPGFRFSSFNIGPAKRLDSGEGPLRDPERGCTSLNKQESSISRVGPPQAL